MSLTVGSLFSGAGGLDLGLERAGMVVRWQCEIDDYATKVLEKHWPDVTRFRDVRQVGAHSLERVDVICGGFPCQPVSVAGKGLAQADPRWLWPEFARIVCELRPRYVVVENVPGLLGRGMGDVLGDLARLGYDAEWESLPAAAFGAPHIRERVFILAYPQCTRLERPARSRVEKTTKPSQRGAPVPHANGSRFSTHTQPYSQTKQSLVKAFRWLDVGRCGEWAPEPDVRRVDDGSTGGMDRLRCLGNAVVPQVAEYIGWCIMKVEGG